MHGCRPVAGIRLWCHRAGKPDRIQLARSACAARTAQTGWLPAGGSAMACLLVLMARIGLNLSGVTPP